MRPGFRRSARASRLIRPHRRSPIPGWGVGAVMVTFILGAGCCMRGAVAIAVQAGERWLAVRVGWLTSIIIIVAGFVVLCGVLDVWRRVTRRATLRWATRSGWYGAQYRTAWPWTSPLESDRVAVGIAVTTVLGTYPVTVGELTWQHDEFPGLVEHAKGTGVFAIVELPHSYPSAAVERRRSRGGSDFFQRYRVVIEDPRWEARCAAAELKAAHLAGTIPPWMLTGGELYVVVSTRRPLSPRMTASLAQRTLRIVELLDLPHQAATSDPAGGQPPAEPTAHPA